MNPTTRQSDTSETSRLKAVFWSVVVLGAVFVLLAGVNQPSSAPGVALGAGLAIANLAAFTYIVRGLTDPESTHGSVVLLGLVKLLVMTVGLYLVLSAGWVRVLPLAVGYGALPLGIVLGQLQPARRAGA